MNLIGTMRSNIKTTEEYLNGYMSTIEVGHGNAKTNQSVIENMDVKELASKINEYYSTIHMVGNPVNSKNYEEDKIDKKINKYGKEYKRAKEKKSSKELAEEQLEEELGMFN